MNVGCVMKGDYQIRVFPPDWRFKPSVSDVLHAHRILPERMASRSFQFSLFLCFSSFFFCTPPLLWFPHPSQTISLVGSQPVFRTFVNYSVTYVTYSFLSSLSPPASVSVDCFVLQKDVCQIVIFSPDTYHIVSLYNQCNTIKLLHFHMDTWFSLTVCCHFYFGRDLFFIL